MKRRIVTTTSVFEPGYPAELALERLAGLGFEALDMALDYWTDTPDSPFLGDHYLKWAESLRKKAEQLSIPYTHAHAPGVAADNPLIKRSLETAGMLGARYIVLHPIWRSRSNAIIESAEEFIRINAEAIQPWLKTAEACGVVILSENLLWGASKDPRVISALVRTVHSDWFGWCYDTGHANCFGYRPDILAECAAAPLSLHLQDNHGDSDEHLIPGDGTVDWNAVIRALHKAGYQGDCVLEAHHQSLEAPDHERDAILTRLMEAARPLRAMME